MAQASLIAKRAVLALILLLALVYAGDYLRVRWKMTHPKTGDAFGTVKMERLLAIPLKDGKDRVRVRRAAARGHHTLRAFVVSAHGRQPVLVPAAQQPETHPHVSCLLWFGVMTGARLPEHWRLCA